MGRKTQQPNAEGAEDSQKTQKNSQDEVGGFALSPDWERDAHAKEAISLLFCAPLRNLCVLCVRPMGL